MKEKSLTSSLQSLHKRQSEYYVKLEKRLSEEEKLSQRTVTSVFHKILVSLIDELKLEVADDLKAELLGKLIETGDLQGIYNVLKEKKILVEDNDESQEALIYVNVCLWTILFATKVSAPVSIIASYAFDNRIFWQSVRNNTYIPVDYRMTSNDLYRTLKTYPEERALFLLQMIPCSSSAFDFLVAGLKNDDEEMFVETVRANDCDLHQISSICYMQGLLTSYTEINAFVCRSLQSQDEKEQEKVDDLLYCKMKDTETLFVQNKEYAEKIQKSIRRELPIEELLNLLDQETRAILSIFEKDLTPKELKMINNIIQTPFVEGVHSFLNELRQANLSDKPEETESTDSDSDANPEFTLPDDYFELPSNEDDCISVDDIHPLVKERGVTVFKDFIEYVAEHGYIENNLETKASFAYRLTGILRPDNLLERIEWKKDKDRNSRCLYYLIKYFYAGNGRKDIGSSALPNGKYERMKRFFICKTDIPNLSSYVIGSSAFRKKLREFFSEKFEEKT